MKRSSFNLSFPCFQLRLPYDMKFVSGLDSLLRSSSDTQVIIVSCRLALPGKSKMSGI